MFEHGENIYEGSVMRYYLCDGILTAEDEFVSQGITFLYPNESNRVNGHFNGECELFKDVLDMFKAQYSHYYLKSERVDGDNGAMLVAEGRSEMAKEFANS